MCTEHPEKEHVLDRHGRAPALFDATVSADAGDRNGRPYRDSRVSDAVDGGWMEPLVAGNQQV